MWVLVLAHAGLGYSCFAEPSQHEGGTTIHFRPEIEDDSALNHSTSVNESNRNVEDQSVVYAVIKGRDRNDGSEKNGNLRERLFAITTTCAANALGLISDDDYAKGNSESAKIALSILARELGTSMEKAPTRYLRSRPTRFCKS